MTIQEWFDKRKEAQIERRAKEMKGIEDSNPSLWIKCVHCDSQILKSDLEENLMVCPHCDYHFRINARKRIAQLFDEGSFEEFFKNTFIDGDSVVCSLFLLLITIAVTIIVYAGLQKGKYSIKEYNISHDKESPEYKK